MRVVIATGIFEPEAGGPATYAPRLAAKLVEAGHTVSVLTFSRRTSYQSDAEYPFSLKRIVRGGRMWNRIRFFFALLRAARTCDVIYTLDWFAVGLPVLCVARLLRVPYVVRVGGDYLWEQRYLELRGEEPITLREFYARGIHTQPAYVFFYRLIRLVLRGAAHVVFNSDVQRELYLRFYGLRSERASTVLNPVPMEHRPAPEHSSKEFVFWGRFIAMKNLISLVRAFKRAEHLQDFTLTLIGDGPQRERLEQLVRNLELGGRVSIEPGMPFKDVIERVKDCRAFVLPSWTDISPNQVVEALAVGLPALVTRENYLSIAAELPATIDPRSVRDIAEKLDMLADEHAYRAFKKKFNAITFTQSWDDTLRQHLDVFTRVLGYALLPMRVLQIGADRSKRGILYPESPAVARQKSYAGVFGQLDIIGFSLRSDRAGAYDAPHLNVYPTDSRTRLFYGLDALGIARGLPRPAVVSVQDPFETGIVGLTIARLKGVPLHVQVHTDFLSPGYVRLSLTNRLRSLAAGFVLCRAKRVRVVSERVRESLQKRYGLRVPITVLPIYVDTARFRNLTPDADLTARFSRFKTRLLAVSRLEPEKNIMLALSAFAKIAPPDACFIIVGDGGGRGALEEFAKASGVADRVFFEGEKNADAYYPIADLVLVPSRYEGYGLVTVEALAAGKPVLSTDVGVAREAGAILTNEEDFADDLKKWFESGPRESHLEGYPYADFDGYVRAYCDDIEACARAK